jgi:transcriptional regulator with XRE-family HTH domain
MTDHRQLLQIRNKKLGLLILDARRVSRRSIEECADVLNITPEEFVEFERGIQAPSLPQMELLALFLNVPLEHFWGKRVLSQTGTLESLQEKDRMLLLRNRVIGTNLRLARNNASKSLEQIAEESGIAQERLSRYEMGEESAPVSELELLADLLSVTLEQFYDRHGPIGRWREQKGNMQKFMDLPPDMQQFISKPVNRPYVELAMRLSELSTEKLRAVAEVLLEITY